MSANYYAVIMAGGGGTRLWPLSRQKRPKQMLRLVDERSLFQTAVHRLDGLFSPDHIFVVTVKDQASILQSQCPEIPDENYLLEPMPRGTASVVALAAIAVQSRDENGVMAVLTADHIIKDENRFHRLLRASFDVAQEGYLVTLGITPLFPATGYGYIQRGEHIGTYQDLDAYLALRFKEKPNEDKAQRMLASGDHVWNSGMFVWRVDRILEEIGRQMPDLSACINQIAEAWDNIKRKITIQSVWPQIIPETIDYGIMEGAQNVAVIPAEGLGWSDVGSWDALFDVIPADSDGNIMISDLHHSIDTRGSLIFSQQPDRLVVTIGIDDLVIVDTHDVLLVCTKDQTQRVRQVVDSLKKEKQGFV